MCPKIIVICLCGCCGETDASIGLFTQLHCMDFSLDFKTLLEKSDKLIVDFSTEKVSGCFKDSASLVLQQCQIK